MDMVPLTAPLLRFHFLDTGESHKREGNLSDNQINFFRVLEIVDSYKSYIFYIIDSIKYYLPCTQSAWEEATRLLRERLDERIARNNTLLTQADGDRNNCYLISKNSTHYYAKKMLGNLIWCRSLEVPEEVPGMLEFKYLKNGPDLLRDHRLSDFDNKIPIPENMLRPKSQTYDQTHNTLRLLYS